MKLLKWLGFLLVFMAGAFFGQGIAEFAVFPWYEWPGASILTMAGFILVMALGVFLVRHLISKINRLNYKGGSNV